MWVGLYPEFAQSRRTSVELLIERDLRDMAEVSMLRHTETVLWWAVKTSRRLRTTNVCICACVHVCVSLCGCTGVCICVLFVIMCSCTTYDLIVLCVLMHLQYCVAVQAHG